MARHQDHAADAHPGYGRAQRVLRRLAGAALALAIAVFGQAAAEPLPAHPFVAYHASWYETFATRAEDATVAQQPGYIDILILSFAKPDLVYRGDLDLSRTGLQYRMGGAMLRDAVAILKKRHPATRVLLSVGGWGYSAWEALDVPALVTLARDLGIDGIDIDYEPLDPGCAPGRDGRIRCRSDASWISYVERIRRAFPRPMLLSVSGWSVGAYGEGQWKDTQPRSPWTGSMLALFRSRAAAHIDHVSIMSYDAGPAYDAAEAFRAYRHHWSGALTLGVQVPFDDARVPRHNLDTARRFAAIAKADPRGGIMLYTLQQLPPGTVGPDNPDYRLFAGAICAVLAPERCDRLPP